MTVLEELLDAGAAHDCEFGGGLSNHLPMTLVALHALGADAARLRACAGSYAGRLLAAPPPAVWPSAEDWTGRLGQRDAYAAYVDLFAGWLAREGASGVLAQVLPRLMPGVGAAAFHGLIRTAYAARAAHGGELAAGLAYWACRHLPLGSLSAAQGMQTAAEPLLRRLRAGHSPARLIFERMHDVAHSDTGLRSTVGRLRVDAGTLEQLARLAAKSYAHSGDFVALHLVTSAHAIGVLLPHVEQPLVAVRWYWQAFATAVVAAGMTAGGPPALQPWPVVVERALASDDEHVIKLVDSCRALERAYGGDAWRLAASRAIA